MVLASDLGDIEKEFSENESKKIWKLFFTNLRAESDKENIDLKMIEARSTKNRTRNRYRDVLPYDHSRVKVNGIGKNDYINASYVQLDSCKQNRRYILTQGPLTSTVSHFWRMVWEQHTTCIIMLNKIIEKDMIKCAQYYPSSINDIISHDYDDNLKLSIKLIEIIDKGAYFVRNLTVEDQSTNEIRQIIQYHYISWPDFGVPPNPVSFLQFLQAIKVSGNIDNIDCHPIIHCSAGIGRSGTFILIDLALLKISEHQSVESVDLKAMLMELRQCRMGLVQASEQLRFAYLAVIVAAKAILNGTDVDDINFDETVSVGEHIQPADETDELSSSDSVDTDSDFSDDSEVMRSNSALDQAAAAVRNRRGIPFSAGFEDSIVINLSSRLSSSSSKNNDNISPINNNDKVVDKIDSQEDSLHLNSVIEDRRLIRENRCNRTRQKVEEIRANMRRQDLERDRLLNRLGLGRLSTRLSGSSRTSLIIVGVGLVVGVVSLLCGLYKYTK